MNNEISLEDERRLVLINECARGNLLTKDLAKMLSLSLRKAQRHRKKALDAGSSLPCLHGNRSRKPFNALNPQLKIRNY